jgi:polygalacturonase
MNLRRTCLLFLSLTATLPAAVFDVKTFGAKGDGQTLDRDSINKAIETAGIGGGGKVHFPAGTYLIGSIRLRSNVTLDLERGTVIEASPDPPLRHR